MRGEVFRLRVSFDTLLISRSASPGATREARTEEDIRAARRALAELRRRAAAGDPEVLAWLRETLDLAFQPPARPLGSQRPPQVTVDRWLSRLGQSFVFGTMQVSLELRRPLPEPPVEPEPPRPPAPPPPREATDTSFVVRFVDETGQAINGLPVEFGAAGDTHPVTTNPAGVALLDHVIATSGTVAVPDPVALEKILDPRWEKFRAPKPQKKPNTVELEFDGGDIAPTSLKPVAEHTVVIKPPLGKLFVELWDRTGRTRHAKRDFTIDGPVSFAGKTDDQGRLLQEGVFPGDYTLSFVLRFFEGKDEQIDAYEAPLVVLPASDPVPEVLLLGRVPRVVLGQVRLLFNTNKAFLLPTAFPSILSLRSLYFANNPSKLLVVGHADTSGPPDFNDQLALDRATAMIAFLKDDVDGWLAFYDTGVP
ncbi:MAG TPA: hypothetical protein VF395_21110, partial [Polyangiaceae bacterium]